MTLLLEVLGLGLGHQGNENGASGSSAGMVDGSSSQFVALVIDASNNDV